MKNKVAPPIIDGHNDTLLNLYLPDRGGGRSFFERSERGHIDLPRAREGGFGGGFFACFVPAKKRRTNPDPPDGGQTTVNYSAELDLPIDPGYARQITDDLVSLIFEIEASSKGQFKVVRTADELSACLENGFVAAILHFEGAEAVETDLGNLIGYYKAGLRSLGLTWSRSNAFATGVPFRFPHGPDTGPGLTKAGRALVKKCNELGIMVDLSHLNEKGFWDVANISDAPLVATHSGAHAMCQSSRNLTDRQLHAIAETNGVVGINFHTGFLREDGRQTTDTPLTEIVRHVEYVAERFGIEHVAFGSDFDGATMPQELGDAAGLPKLMAAFRERGYDEESLGKVANGNWQRVLRETWKDG